MSWPIVSLGEIATKIGSGATPRGGSKAYKLKGTPLVRSMNVHDGVFQPHGLAFIDDKQAMALDNVILSGGDVLLNITGASVARCCRLPSNYAGGRVNQHVAIIRPKTDVIRSDYLEQLLTSPDTKRQLLGIAGGGATREAITKAAIENFEIPLPPLEEQKRIAAILDQADALRRLRTHALEKLNTLGQAIFYEMFGARSPQYAQFPEYFLGDLVDNLDGKRVPIKLADREKRTGNIPYYGASGIIDSIDEWLFEGPHLLVGEDGANLLARNSPIAFMAEGKFWVNNHAHVLAENGRAKLRFLQYFIESIDLTPYVTGSAQPKLNQKQLNRIPVRLPPMAEQNRFVAALDARRNSIQEVTCSAARTESLFASLQHRAFRGEL